MKPLGTLLVRETHGIRRFLYPLATTLELPHGVAPADLGLARSGGQPVPLQCTLEPKRDSAAVRIDFAVSLAPYEQVTLILGTGMDTGLIDDPISLRAADGYVSEQRRVRLEFERTGSISQILYDGIRHLRGPSRITRNGEAAAGTDHVINAGRWAPACSHSANMQTVAAPEPPWRSAPANPGRCSRTSSTNRTRTTSFRSHCRSRRVRP